MQVTHLLLISLLAVSPIEVPPENAMNILVVEPSTSSVPEMNASEIHHPPMAAGGIQLYPADEQ